MISTFLSAGDLELIRAPKKRRNVKKLQQELFKRCTVTPDVARQCFYEKPVDGGKDTVVGPSVRFAELVADTWGNIAYGYRVAHMGQISVTVHGYALDTQTNVWFTSELQRSIDDWGARKKGEDIEVFTKSMGAIITRDCVLKVVPAAFVEETLDSIIAWSYVAQAEIEEEALKYLESIGISRDKFRERFGHDFGFNQYRKVFGFKTALQTGEATLDDLFPMTDAEKKTERAKRVVRSINGMFKSIIFFQLVFLECFFRIQS
jgi:hypothetical protein